MALLCARIPADKVDYENERFVVCKSVGVNAYGTVYQLGEELPQGVLPARALREIYDTPLRLIETMDFALADEQLLALMLARCPPTEETGESASVVTGDGAPDKVRPGKGKKR